MNATFDASGGLGRSSGSLGGAFGLTLLHVIDMFSDFGIILAPFCSSSARLGCLGGTFGVTWGVLVPLLAHQAVLGDHLGALGEHLGSLWRPCGVTREPLGSIRAHFGGLGGSLWET